jgi:hypothetical protein
LTSASLFLSLPSHAYFPFITDDTGTQGEGGNQLELNYVFTKERGVGVAADGTYFPGDYGTSNAFPITYTRGLTDNLDVFVGIIRQTSPTNGWMNSAVGLKWRFAGNAEEGWSFAIKPALLTPVSRSMEASGLGNGKTNGSVSLISSYLQPTYEVHLNARYTSNLSYSGAEEQQAQHLWGVSVAPVWVLAWMLDSKPIQMPQVLKLLMPKLAQYLHPLKMCNSVWASSEAELLAAPVENTTGPSFQA